MLRDLLKNLEGAKFQVLFNLATRTSYSKTNYVKIPAFHYFLKGEYLSFKNDKYQLLKVARSVYIVILIKS